MATTNKWTIFYTKSAHQVIWIKDKEDKDGVTGSIFDYFPAKKEEVLSKVVTTEPKDPAGNGYSTYIPYVFETVLGQKDPVYYDDVNNKIYYDRVFSSKKARAVPFNYSNPYQAGEVLGGLIGLGLVAGFAHETNQMTRFYKALVDSLIEEDLKERKSELTVPTPGFANSFLPITTTRISPTVVPKVSSPNFTFATPAASRANNVNLILNKVRIDKPNYGINPGIAGQGYDLYTAIPEDVADANRALSNSLRQIKNVFSVDAQQLATVTKELETTKGLDKIEALESKLPDEVINFYKDEFGEGSGANGEFLVTDIIGTVAGYVHNDELPIVASDIQNLANLGELTYLEECYQALRDLFDGEFTHSITSINPSPPPPSVTTYFYIIPTGTTRIGSNARTYGSMNEAADAIMDEIETEVDRLATAYPDQASQSLVSFNNMSAQVKREKDNMPKAGIVPADTQTGVKTSVIGLVKNLHDHGRDDSLGGTAWILENVADKTTLSGQAVIASLREGRNIKRLDDAGIGNSIMIPADPRTVEKATLINSKYTIQEAKNNL